MKRGVYYILWIWKYIKKRTRAAKRERDYARDRAKLLIRQVDEAKCMVI